MFAERGERNPAVHWRLERAAWINRIEVASMASYKERLARGSTVDCYVERMLSS